MHPIQHIDGGPSPVRDINCCWGDLHEAVECAIGVGVDERHQLRWGHRQIWWEHPSKLGLEIGIPTGWEVLN